MSLIESIALIKNANNLTSLLTLHRGIEREALRINAQGHIATSSHPQELGSALTHSRITTDYSESLLEFITPVTQNINELLEGLTQTHAFTLKHINGEALWPVSMPCHNDERDDIQIAQYGSSNIGKMKTLYRKGLTYRYGALMQIISGVHFNFSVSEPLWDLLYEQSDKKLSRQDFISERYFGLIRNYRRIMWVLPYLFGASPVLCHSFMPERQTALKFEKTAFGDQYLPYATSLRMSDLGYTNKEQEHLSINYNSLPEYLATVREAIKMSSDKFAEIGVKVDGEYRQLNANILQIENELYSPIRAKRVTFTNEDPSDALARGGVEYIEVRALDVNPFSAIGIDESQVRFLDMLLLHCLFSDAPANTTCEENEISTNFQAVVLSGRDPALTLKRNNQQISREAWLQELFNELKPLAELLDGAISDQKYNSALTQWQGAVTDPTQTLSGKIMTAVQQSDGSYHKLITSLAEEYQTQLLNYPLTEEVTQAYIKEAADSLKKQQQIEAADELSFDAFIAEKFDHIYPK